MQNITDVTIENLSASSAQPRSIFDDEKLIELANSIIEHGILQPIIVKPKQEAIGHYEIIAGERRWRAAALAGLNKVPCIIMDLNTHDALSVALVENIQRENLTPIEEANAYKKICDELKMSPHDLALRVGKDRSSIANSIRLLALPEKIQQMLTQKDLTAGHAKALLGLENQEIVTMLAQKIVRDGLSVRKTESLVRAVNSGNYDTKPKNTTESSPLQKEIEQIIQRKLGTKVSLKKEQEGYWMNIHFSSIQELNEILKKLEVTI